MERKPIKFKDKIECMTLDEVCKQFEALVCKIARKWTIRYEFEDVKQVGYMGLVKAYDSYSIEKDVLFTTYATLIVKGHLCRFYRDDKSKFEGTISLNQTFKNNDNKETQYVDLVEDENNYEDIALANIEQEKLKGAINLLKSPYKEIIEDLHFKNIVQTQIAKKLNVSQAQVSRFYKKALEKLKKIMEDGENMPEAKITREQLLKEAKKLGTGKKACEVIAKKYNLNPSTIKFHLSGMGIIKELNNEKISQKENKVKSEIKNTNEEIITKPIDKTHSSLLKQVLIGNIGEYEIKDTFININLDLGNISVKKEDIFNFIAELKELSEFLV